MCIRDSPKWKSTGHNTTSRDPRGNFATGVFRNKDTSVKQVHKPNDQNAEPVEIQIIGDIDIGDLAGSNDSQGQDDCTSLQLTNQEDQLDTSVNQMSKASQEDNYCTAIDDDNHDDTVQFGNPVTQPFLSRSIRVPITEVGC